MRISPPVPEAHEPMTQRIGDLLWAQEKQGFFGREAELDTLVHGLAADAPLVTCVHGIGGIGKTALLHAFADRARRVGCVVVQLDCRCGEPTERGLLQMLGEALGASLPTLEDAATRLGRLGTRIALTFDTYELFRLLDGWLRQVFIPALPENIRVFLFGREPPVVTWSTAPGWLGLFHSLPLGPLDPTSAAAVLAADGVTGSKISRVNRFARGHPLALRLAAAALTARPDLDMADVEDRYVIEELAKKYLEDVQDPLARQALEAASVIRCASRSIMAHLLPNQDSQQVFDRLLALPFTELGRDGLLVHDTIRQSVSRHLQVADLPQYLAYRRAAWQALRAEMGLAGTPYLWRYTADVLYLIDHPVVHDAFFPSGVHLYSVEMAQPEDGEAIREITRRHDGPEAYGWVEQWWEVAPEGFFVARDKRGVVAGYYLLLDPARVDREALLCDPVTRAWWRHVEKGAAGGELRVLFNRRTLTAADGENLCGVQAACWLDMKRAYLEDPAVKRNYTTMRGVSFQLPVLQKIGFKGVRSLNVELDGTTYHSLVNDFGPNGVYGWLTSLLDAQYGSPGAWEIDQGARELVIDGQRVRLTPLEFGVLNLLQAHPGKVLARTELREQVWGYDFEGVSNVVDVVVRSLRKKLGEHARDIETVSRVGYRLSRSAPIACR